jgi:hypothetical protein
MDWINIAGAGVSGGLAALLASLVTKNRRSKTYFVAFIVLFLVIKGAMGSMVLPQIKIWEGHRDMEELLSTNKVYGLLAERHPEFRAGWMALGDSLIRAGASYEDAQRAGEKWGRTRFSKYQTMYAPHASDEAVLAYFSLYHETLHVFESDADLCYRYAMGLGFDPSGGAARFITPEMKKQNWDVLGEVIESALTSPQSAPDVEYAEGLAEALVIAMAEKHGEEFVMTLAVEGDPATASAETRRAVADAFIALYDAAADLSDSDRSIFFRYSLGFSEKFRM